MNRKQIKKFLHSKENDELVPRCKYVGELTIDGLIPNNIYWIFTPRDIKLIQWQSITDNNKGLCVFNKSDWRYLDKAECWSEILTQEDVDEILMSFEGVLEEQGDTKK